MVYRGEKLFEHASTKSMKRIGRWSSSRKASLLGSQEHYRQPPTSPLSQPRRSSWKKFGSAKKFASAVKERRVDLGIVPLLEDSRIQSGSSCSDRSGFTENTTLTPPEHKELDFPSIYTASPSYDIGSVGTGESIYMDDTEQRWHSLQQSLSEEDVAHVLRGIDISKYDFTDLVQKLEDFKQQQQQQQQQNIPTSLHRSTLSNGTNDSTISGSLHTAASESLSFERKYPRFPKEEEEVVVFEETMEREPLSHSRAFPVRPRLWNPLQKGKRNPPKYDSNLERHKFKSAFEPISPRTEMTSLDDSDEADELVFLDNDHLLSDAPNSCEDNYCDAASSDDFLGSLAKRRSFDVWGLNHDDSMEEISIVESLTIEEAKFASVLDEDEDEDEDESEDEDSNDSKNEHVLGIKSRIALDASISEKPQRVRSFLKDLDASLENNSKKEKPRGAVSLMYQEAFRKTSRIGAGCRSVGISMSEALSSITSNLCSPVESYPTPRQPGHRFESNSDGFSATSYSSHSFSIQKPKHYIVEQTDIDERPAPSLINNDQSEDAESDVVLDGRNHGDILENQHESIEFSSAEPPALTIINKRSNSSKSSRSLGRSPISSYMEPHLGAIPMAGPDSFPSSTGSLTTISQPFGESYNYRTSGPRSFSPARNDRTPSPKMRGLPPKPSSPSSHLRPPSSSQKLRQARSSKRRSYH